MIRLPSPHRTGHLGSTGMVGVSFEDMTAKYIAKQDQAQVGVSQVISNGIANAFASGSVSTEDLRNLATNIAGAGAGAVCVAAGAATGGVTTILAPLCAAIGKSVAGSVIGLFSNVQDDPDPNRNNAFTYDAVEVFAQKCPSDQCREKVRNLKFQGHDRYNSAEFDDAGTRDAWLAQWGDVATAYIIADRLRIEADFLDRVTAYASQVFAAYSPFCVGTCDLGWLQGAAEQLAYESLSAQRFPGNQSPTFIANSHRKEIEGLIKSFTGTTPVDVDFTPVTQAQQAEKDQQTLAVLEAMQALSQSGTSAPDESSALPTVLYVAAAAALGWIGWRTYKKKPLLPKF